MAEDDDLDLRNDEAASLATESKESIASDFAAARQKLADAKEKSPTGGGKGKGKGKGGRRKRRRPRKKGSGGKGGGATADDDHDDGGLIDEAAFDDDEDAEGEGDLLSRLDKIKEGDATRKAQKAEEARRHDAATRIQARFRGNKGRRHATRSRARTASEQDQFEADQDYDEEGRVYIR